MTIFELAIKNYNHGYGPWTEDMLQNLVNKKKLSASDYKEITGETVSLDTIESVMEYKIDSLSDICEETILNGMDIELEDGSTHHFSYTEKDQLNIRAMFDAVKDGATEYPYHYDNGQQAIISKNNAKIIYSKLAIFLISQTTYYNQLKMYVQTLSDIDSIEAVKYGQELTGQYLDVYNAIIANYVDQMNTIVSKY